MIPSVVGRELKERFESLLRTQFRVPAGGPFSRLWDDFFSDGDRLIKGPYLELPLPFRKDGNEAELVRFAPAIERLAFPPYRHQVKSFNRLGEFKSTLVATGTGSGKTECFTLPILKHCAAHKNEDGIRAILIYPMNALATDQAKRLAETIYRNPGLDGVRVGLYIGETKGKGHRKARPLRWREMTKDPSKGGFHVITDRDELLAHPPHILMTNYKMLDYLILRPHEQRLWRFNESNTSLRYLAVDELHTFDGAQAADLACLLRRLKERLGMPDESLCCIGTSATLGSGAEASRQIREYAEKIFSVAFPSESLVAEDRLSFGEMKAGTGDAVFDDPLVAAMFEELKGRAKALDEIARALVKRGNEELWDDPPKDEDDCKARIIDACARLSDARAKKGRDYPDVRMQYWIREFARAAADVPQAKTDGEYRARLGFSDDLEEPERLLDAHTHYLPATNCNICGATGWIGLVSHKGDAIEGTRRQIYEAALGGRVDEDVRYLYPLDDGDDKPRFVNGSVRRLCGKCLQLNPEGAVKCACGHESLIRVVVQKPEISDGGSSSVACPYCGGDHNNNLIIGMRSATMLSTCISSITTSRNNDDKKLLAFSDNVQDTSHRAGFFGARTWSATFRAHLAQYLASLGTEEAGYRDFLSGFPEYLQNRLGDSREMLAELIPQDLKWLGDWRKLEGDDPPHPSERTMKAFFARLRWETAVEFGCGQHLGRTLKRVEVASMEAVLPGADAEVWNSIAHSVSNRTEALRVFAGSPMKVRSSAVVIAAEMIRTGAFEDESLLNSEGTVWSSILRLVLAQSRMGVVNGLESCGIPVYKTKRSSHVSAPGYAQKNSMRRLPVLESLAPGHPISDRLREIGVELDEESLAELMSSFEKEGILRGFHQQDKVSYWYLPIERLVIRKLTPSIGAERNPFRNQYLDGDICRVNPLEHTGLLGRDERETLESRFKTDAFHRWDPNLISATPTLEMGVDIGDLSSVLLCSVPPNQSKFIQRIGRSGRRNGSALNVTVAAAKPHDLYFFRDPAEMISGSVTSPGVFLNASAILERQYFGFALGEWMRSKPASVLQGNIGAMFKDIEDNVEGCFPKAFEDWYDEEKESLFQRFIERLGPIHFLTFSELQDYAYTHVDDEKGILRRLRDAVSSTHTSLKNYDGKCRDLLKVRSGIKKDPGLSEELRTERLDEINREIKSYTTFIYKLKRQSVIGWMCDCVGLLPNYAFPEPGVSLQSILWRKETKAGGTKYEKIEIARPASAGLTELVPGSVFYTHGFNMLIDQVDLQRYDEAELEHCSWRFCPDCDHIERVSVGMSERCPVCGADWSDNGQCRNMLLARQFITVKPQKGSLTDDSRDDRDKSRYECRKFFELKRLGDRAESFSCEKDGKPFGFEYVPNLVMREVNFGVRSAVAEGEEPARVNGDVLTGRGFSICRECNKAVPVRRNAGASIDHQRTCKSLMRPTDEAQIRSPVNAAFYREYHTEALRIFAPFLGEADDTRILSFMAAIQLGLKKHFKGEVDHLQMEVQSLPLKGKDVREHYLILYDAVPGGTGYVRQFVEGTKPRLLFEIFEEALASLKGCACGHDPKKDGCYNCLYRYRNQHGRNALSRKVAIEILQELLEHKTCIRKVERASGIGASTAVLIESELEHQFVLRLERLAKELGGKFEEATVRGYVKGWRLSVPGAFRLGAESVAREWEIVPQKTFKPEDGVLVPSRPDFMFYPQDADGTKRAKPVAVFLDGWEFHKDSISDDVVKRKALMEAGYRVWSLSWENVAPLTPKMTGAVKPAWMQSLTDESAEIVRRRLGSRMDGDNGERARAWKEGFDDCKQEIERFMAYLRTSDDGIFKKHATFESMVMASAGAEVVPSPALTDLPSAFSSFLSGEKHLRGKEHHFGTAIAMSRDAVSAGGVRMRLAATLDDRADVVKDAWQGFFGFVTFFQFLDDGFLFWTAKGRMDPFWNNLMSVRSGTAGIGESDWKDALDAAEGDAVSTGILMELKAAGLPPPKMYEDIVAEDGSVTASPWMQWPERKIMALDGDSADDAERDVGWKVISLSADDDAAISLAKLKEAFNGQQDNHQQKVY